MIDKLRENWQGDELMRGLNKLSKRVNELIDMVGWQIEPIERQTMTISTREQELFDKFKEGCDFRERERCGPADICASGSCPFIGFWKMMREEESPRTTGNNRKLGSRYQECARGKLADRREGQRRVVDRRATKEGDPNIGRRCGHRLDERRQADRREAPLRKRLAEVLYEAGVNDDYLYILHEGWPLFRLEIADAIIKELGL